jgi:hypothetical protein
VVGFTTGSGEVPGKRKHVIREQQHNNNNTNNDHLTSGCLTLAKDEYIIGHGRVCTHLRYSVCKKSGIGATENWYI